VEYSSAQIAKWAISENDFSLVLQLVEGRPTPLNAGFADWKHLYRTSRDCGDLSMTASAIQNIFSFLASSGRAKEALLCSRRLFALGHEIGDPLIVGHALTDIAWANWVIGDHISAVEVAQEALQFANDLGAKPLLHPFTGPEAIKKAATDLLLTIKHSRGELRRSLADQRVMLQIHRERGDSLLVISTMEGLGNLHKDLGENTEALKWFSEALQEVESADFREPRARLLTRAGLLGNMGVVLTNVGNTEEALKRIEESANIYSRLSDGFGQIGSYGQRGRALLRAGRLPESLDALHTMLQLTRQYDAQSWQQAAHLNLARAYVALGSRSEAAVHCERAVALAREKLGNIGVDLYWLRAAVFHPQGAVKSDDGAAGDAARFIALAYFAFEALHKEMRGSKPSVVVRRWIDEFEAIIQAAFLLPATQSLRLPPIQHRGGRNNSVGTSLDSLDALAHGSPFAAWLPLDIGLYCIESFRAQEFQERLLLNAADLELTHDPHVASELSRVEAELEVLRSRPPIVVAGAASFDEEDELVMKEPASEESVAKQRHEQQKYVKRVAELSAARDVLMLKTIQSNTVPAVPLQSPARLSDVRDVLRDDEMLLEFVLLGQSDGTERAAGEVVLLPSDARPDSAFAVAITRSWMDVVPLGATAAIERQFRKLLDMIDRFGSALSLSFFQDEAIRAFDLLLRPVWNRAGAEMKAVRHLVIATDGVLSLFPLDILIERRCEPSCWRNFDYLTLHFSTEYTPSATVFVDLRLGRYKRGESGDTFVGFGDPKYQVASQSEALPSLPGSRLEIEAIAALARKAKGSFDSHPVTLFLGADARKDRLSDPQMLRNAEYIHLACHGSGGKYPHLDGALFLADSESGDPAHSVLTTREVMNLRTNTKLVVMSACESGLGTLTRGEGIQGLVRAWLFAGAQSVIATLWEVEDNAAAELMEAFYRALLESVTSTTEALAAAKRRAIDDERFACPVYWAAFAGFGGRFEDPSHQRIATTGVDRFATLDPLQKTDVAVAMLGQREHSVLRECGRAWEAAWSVGRDRKFQAFREFEACFDASMELATSVSASIGVTYEFPITVALGLVAQNCRTAWEYWTKEHRISLAVPAYRAYTMWEPSERLEDWDAVVSAYRPENMKQVRDLARGNLLPREFEIRVDDSLRVSITTTVSQNTTESQTVGPADCIPLEIALPVDDPEFTSSSANFVYCRGIGLVVISLRPGESFRVTEQLTSSVRVLEDDTYLIGRTWGSSLFSHLLTIRLHPDFVPIRFEQQQIGRASCIATVRFAPEGPSVMLRPVRGPWLERIALLFRRAPGASALLGAANSPFSEEMEFKQFESLLQQIGRQQQPG
jgi:CHAT domain-containing protein